MDALATAGELETHLQRAVDTTQAELALQLASGAVRAFCGWDLAEQTGTLTAAGSGTIVLTLPTMHLTQVIEVRIGGVAMVDIGPLYLAATKRGQIIRYAGWPDMVDIEVDCVHGYDPIPDVIKLVTLEQAARAMNNPQGLLQATVGSVSRTWAGPNQQRLSPLDERLLERYQI